MTKSNQWVL